MANEHGGLRTSYAIITPSYAPDFERCRVLVESVRRYAAPHVEHHLVVDRRDERLFSALAGPRTHVAVKQAILPPWLRQIPTSTRWWLSRWGRPVRGWMVQQIIKLSVDAITGADGLIFIDSDAFLVRPFDPRDRERDGKVPMFRETLPASGAHHAAWIEAASALLGVPAERGCRTSYVDTGVTWLRKNVVSLHHHLERVTGSGWIEAMCRLHTMSEYVLYGVYCERVLGERSGHYWDDTIHTLSHWTESPLDAPALSDLRQKLRAEHDSVMINGKSRTEVAAIRRAFDLSP